MALLIPEADPSHDANPEDSSEEKSSCCSQTDSQEQKGCSSCEPVTGSSCCGTEVETSSPPWFRIGIALAIAGQAMVFGLGYNNALRAGEAPAFGSTVYWLLHGLFIASTLAVVAMLGRPLLREFYAAVRARHISVEALFVASLLGAFAGSVVSTFSGAGDVYYEVVAIVLVVYTAGKYIGARSREKVMAEVGKLREDYRTAYVLDAEWKRQERPVADLCKTNSRVSVQPGEVVTVDGVILDGEGYVTETALTGEPTPMVRRSGDHLLAGSHSVDGTFIIRPEKLEGERRIDAILDTVEAARNSPSRLQEQADRLIRWFFPLVMLISAGTFAAWMLVPGAVWWEALFNAMAVLLVACPCALGLATPIAIWGGLQRLSQYGLVAGSGSFVDSVAQATHLAFDKTGTLSEDRLVLTDFVVADSFGTDREWVRQVVAAVEGNIDHPIARTLAEGVEHKLSVRSLRLIPGHGARARVGIRDISVGDLALMPDATHADFQRLVETVTGEEQNAASSLIYVAVDGQAAAVFLLEEQLRERAEHVFKELQSLGLKISVMTGDAAPRWREIGGIELETALSPQDKERRVQALRNDGAKVLFVGDGINDAAAMARAEASVAMGSGAALTRSAADAVLMGNALEPIPDAIRVARRARSSIQGNMRFAVVYNGIGIALAAAGLLHPVVAALLMVVSSAVVSTRAMRAVKPVPDEKAG